MTIPLPAGWQSMGAIDKGGHGITFTPVFTPEDHIDTAWHFPHTKLTHVQKSGQHSLEVTFESFNPDLWDMLHGTMPAPTLPWWRRYWRRFRDLIIR